MSSTERSGFTPAAREGLESRYGPDELLEQLHEQTHEQQYWSRIAECELTIATDGSAAAINYTGDERAHEETQWILTRPKNIVEVTQ